MAHDIERGIDAIERITGQRPQYFRPPQGLRVPTLRYALERLEPLTCATWSARGVDTIGLSANVVARRITRYLTPGAIVLLHDGSCLAPSRDRAPTLDALEQLLRTAAERKFACVRLDELLEGAG